MQFKKNRPGLPLYVHHEYWPTSHDEDKECEDWQIKIIAAVRDWGSRQFRYKSKGGYKRGIPWIVRKKQAFEAKQQQQQTKKVDNNDNSLLKKLSEKK